MTGPAAANTTADRHVFVRNEVLQRDSGPRVGVPREELAEAVRPEVSLLQLLVERRARLDLGYYHMATSNI